MAGKSAEQQTQEKKPEATDEWKPDESALTPEELKKLAKSEDTKNQAVDKAQLSDPKMTAMYDAYVREKGKPPTNEWLYSWTSSWKKDKVDYVKYAEADLRGLVKHQRQPANQKKYDAETDGGRNPGAYTGKWAEYAIWTPDAVSHVGGKVDVSFMSDGTTILVPKGAYTGGDVQSASLKGDSAAGFQDAYGVAYDQVVGIGSDSGGLVGSVFGKDAAAKVSDILPDFIQANYDFGFVQGALLGREGAKDVGGFYGSVGLSKVKPYVDVIGQTALKVGGAVGGGPAGAAGASAIVDLGKAYSTEAQGFTVDWRNAIKDTAVNATVAYGAGALSRSAAEAKAANDTLGTAASLRGLQTAQFAATAGSIGLSAAGTYIKTGDLNAAAVGAAAGAAGSMIGGGPVMQAGTAAATSYLLSSGSDSSVRLQMALASAGTSVASSALSGEFAASAPKPKPFTGGALLAPYVKGGAGLSTSDWRDSVRSAGVIKQNNAAIARYESQYQGPESAPAPRPSNWNQEKAPWE